MTQPTGSTPDSRHALRARNVRLGLILASVAAVFFIGFVTRLVLLKH